jgi:hypothetical protein
VPSTAEARALITSGGGFSDLYDMPDYLLGLCQHVRLYSIFPRHWESPASFTYMAPERVQHEPYE